MELNVQVRLTIDSAPNFRRAELLSDLHRVLRELSEPEPTRKPHRVAWSVAAVALAFENAGDQLAAEADPAYDRERLGRMGI